MSRIGNKTIVVPAGVEVKIEDNVFIAKGSKGELSQEFNTDFVSVEIGEGEVKVSRNGDSKGERSHHGLYRSLFANMIDGVETEFSKTLEVRGVGYRVAQKGSALEFRLGFSHEILFEIPASLKITFDEKNQNIFTISGIDKQLVGQVAANIRQLKKPEPYKGKGIRYIDEVVILKAGKSAAK